MSEYHRGILAGNPAFEGCIMKPEGCAVLCHLLQNDDLTPNDDSPDLYISTSEQHPLQDLQGLHYELRT